MNSPRTEVLDEIVVSSSYLQHKPGDDTKRPEPDNNREQPESDSDSDFDQWLPGEYEAFYGDEPELAGLESGGDLELQPNSSRPKSNGNSAPGSDEDSETGSDGNWEPGSDEDSETESDGNLEPRSRRCRRKRRKKVARRKGKTLRTCVCCAKEESGLNVRASGSLLETSN
ncbi:hypothetical protein B0T14DRAFT_559391 [Immersiella caudata]|uniref:Uncharacterized protein n=1 Tax=Immersiella caudata TaxID=314043 RepID=A0AA39XCV7_9PEZI|nr:hypothetical protein B0T14DRAFT_559391 [Immersiella caudata]